MLGNSMRILMFIACLIFMWTAHGESMELRQAKSIYEKLMAMSDRTPEQEARLKILADNIKAREESEKIPRNERYFSNSKESAQTAKPFVSNPKEASVPPKYAINKMVLILNITRESLMFGMVMDPEMIWRPALIVGYRNPGKLVVTTDGNDRLEVPASGVVLEVESLGDFKQFDSVSYLHRNELVGSSTRTAKIFRLFANGDALMVNDLSRLADQMRLVKKGNFWHPSLVTNFIRRCENLLDAGW